MAIKYLYTMQRMYIFLILIGTFGMLRCTIDSARSAENRQLVIASDYLTEADTLLFAAFSDRKNIHVLIRHLDAVTIHELLRSQGPNAGFDIVMLESEHDVHTLAFEDLLQKLPEDHELPKEAARYSSAKFNYRGFALDPYSVACTPASPKVSTYNDLTRVAFIDDLSPQDKITLLAPVSRKMEKGIAQAWILKFAEHGIRSVSDRDSAALNTPILCKRSQFIAGQSDTSGLYRKKELRILTSGKNGSFYNLRTLCIASQCENYSEAQAFLHHYLTEKPNAVLCRKLHLVSVYRTGADFRPYKLSTEELLSYHTLVKRILDRLGID